MTYLAALDHYDQQRDPHDHVLDKVLPADPGPTHAVRQPEYGLRSRPLREPTFLDAYRYETAMCGRRVKVLLPLEFDPGDEDSCPRCVGPVIRGERTPHRERDDGP